MQWLNWRQLKETSYASLLSPGKTYKLLSKTLSNQEISWTIMEAVSIRGPLPETPQNPPSRLIQGHDPGNGRSACLSYKCEKQRLFSYHGYGHCKLPLTSGTDRPGSRKLWIEIKRFKKSELLIRVLRL
jgi:hypothetical protein